MKGVVQGTMVQLHAAISFIHDLCIMAVYKGAVSTLFRFNGKNLEHQLSVARGFGLTQLVNSIVSDSIIRYRLNMIAQHVAQKNYSALRRLPQGFRAACACAR